MIETFDLLDARLASSTVELALGPSSYSFKNFATARDTCFFLPALCLCAREEVALDLCSQFATVLNVTPTMSATSLSEGSECPFAMLRISALTTTSRATMPLSNIPATHWRLQALMWHLSMIGHSCAQLSTKNPELSSVSRLQAYEREVTHTLWPRSQLLSSGLTISQNLVLYHAEQLLVLELTEVQDDCN